MAPTLETESLTRVVDDERIVERHGGEIWVVSERGEGATFYFTLPAADVKKEDQSTITEEEPMA